MKGNNQNSISISGTCTCPDCMLFVSSSRISCLLLSRLYIVMHVKSPKYQQRFLLPGLLIEFYVVFIYIEQEERNSCSNIDNNAVYILCKSFHIPNQLFWFLLIYTKRFFSFFFSFWRITQVISVQL